MGNRLLEEVEYKVKQTKLGVWRSYGYSNGANYHEFTSHAKSFGAPLIHYTSGVNPETGRRKAARGVIAVGRIAYGVVAIGQLAVGFLALGQAGIGLVIGVGQISTGIFSAGMLAIGVLFGLGIFTTGYVAIGLFAYGYYVLAYLGKGNFVWSMQYSDFEAVKFFKDLPILRDLLG